MPEKKTPRNKKNTRKLVILKLMRSMMLIIPVITLFYVDHWLTMSQIMLLQSIFSISLFSLEIPTGYISDRFGRRQSITIWYSVLVIWFVAYWLGDGFWSFAMAEIVLAFGYACISGSDSALLYDTVCQWGKPEVAKKREWRLSFAGDIAWVMAGVVWGFVGAYYGMDILWLISAWIVAAGLPLARSLEEVRHPSHQETHYHIFHDAGKIIQTFRSKPKILWLILYTGIIAYATYSLVWSQQQWMLQLGAPVAWFGVLWGIARMFVAGWGLWAHRYDEYLGRGNGLIMLLVWVIVGFILMAVGVHWIIAFAWLCVAFSMRWVQSSLSSYYINTEIDSSLRATTLSSMSMIHRIIFAVVLPLQWWIGDHYGLQTMFVIMIGVFVVTGGLVQWKLYQT